MRYSPAEQAKLIAEAKRRGLLGAPRDFASLEDLLTSPDGFGLTGATPLQRAVCRIADRQPLGELADDVTVQRALGGARNVPTTTLRELMFVAAVRGAKSLIAAAIAIRAARTCDLSILAPGEIPRFGVISISKDNAKVIHGHILGALKRPAIAQWRVDEKTTNEWREVIDATGLDMVGSEFLWHPSGRPIEITVLAGKRAGASVVSRWLVGLVLDEAPRMVGSSEGVVNYDDTRRSALARLLPGSLLYSIGSPWAPFGPVYDIVQREHGNPTKTRVVVRGRGDDLNPLWWTPERQAELKEEDELAYKTDFLAEFADVAESLYGGLIEQCTRKTPLELPPQRGHEYIAVMDPATRGNAWTLVIGTRTGRKKRVALARQWQGSKLRPLKSSAVLSEIAQICKPYGVTSVITDQWAADVLRDMALEALRDEDGKKIELDLIIEDWTASNKTAAHLALAAEMAEDGNYIELPPDPLVAKDLRVVKKRPTQASISIDIPQTTDGRHGDYASAMAKLFHRWIEEDRAAPSPVGVDEYWRERERLDIASEIEQIEQSQGKEWWEHQ